MSNQDTNVPSRPRRPVWDNPRGQLPGTGLPNDNLYETSYHRTGGFLSPARSVLPDFDAADTTAFR